RQANSGEASPPDELFSLMHSLRLSTSGSSTVLGRFAAARLAAAARGGRSVSAAPGMEHPRDDMHNTKEDETSHPFGVAYSTRSDEEGFGGVYARDDDRPASSRPTAEAHPSHPPPPGTFCLFLIWSY
uniref:Uncharacterized protein n=1 Tax=Aegilops tauschii subsp. strangulata TaxID=200361 RepID=A0A453N544_AEGTS